MTGQSDSLAFAMYAQQRCGGLGADVDVDRARLLWEAEDAEQVALWRSKATGVLAVLALSQSDDVRDELARFIEDLAFVLPNLNDTFAYACADTEQISVGDGDALAAYWRRHGAYAFIAIAAFKRRREPASWVADRPEYIAAIAELRALGDLYPDDPELKGWTLQDEFELRPYEPQPTQSEEN